MKQSNNESKNVIDHYFVAKPEHNKEKGKDDEDNETVIKNTKAN
jgi:hypothetical protein